MSPGDAARGPASRTDASPGDGRRAVVLPVVVALGAAAAAVVLAVRTPYVPLSYGFCPSVVLLGVSCPGCGGLRATHDLVTGDLAGAWQANPLWTLAAPVLVGLWSAWSVRRWRTAPARPAPRWLWWAVLGVVVAFGVLRNVPALVPWLGPAPLP